MFSKSANYYDEIYNSMGKEYPNEARKAHKLIQKYKKSEGTLLLDVGCGTGHHAGLFRKHYQVEGLDLDPNILSVARKKYPKIRFHQANMIDFKLNKKFDAIVCLFSSIGYVRTKSNLNKAIKTLTQHLLPGGVILIEPWFSPSEWHTGRVFTLQVNKPDLKIFRMSHSSRKGNISIIEFQYLVGTSKGIQHSMEQHQLGLFNKKDYLEAFRKTGLKVIHDPKGLDGRGLYIGIKPMDKK
ncbi:MAG: class I SAM-dependent methyltransferase [Anaerolineales bacterium]|nr:class I SAM-dependent methyltransferase [Anaerolineales bacterium]